MSNRDGSRRLDVNRRIAVLARPARCDAEADAEVARGDAEADVEAARGDAEAEPTGDAIEAKPTNGGNGRTELFLVDAPKDKCQEQQVILSTFQIRVTRTPRTPAHRHSVRCPVCTPGTQTPAHPDIDTRGESQRQLPARGCRP
jgi:hypothetical protein